VKRLAAFPKVRVVVLGDLVADHYLYGQTERISREAPVLIVRHERDEVKLGGGANAAANARALGGRVTVVGHLGADEMGRALRGLCEAQGIDVEAVSAKGVSTETKLRILAGGLSTSRQQMLRVDRGVTGPLPISLRRALATRLARAVDHADVVLVSDYGAGVVCDETRAVVREAARQGVVVCVDSRFSLGAFKGASLCKPNEPELGAMTGLPVSTDAEVDRAAHRALELLECQALLVTRGRKGMVVYEPGQRPVRLPVHGSEEAVDVTGAGDTVIATMALSLGAGASFIEAARLSNVAGGLVVQKPGTATVTRAELARELSR
jgi:D-glycero-beta-D-manno-heptose-7-phosphate kinase